MMPPQAEFEQIVSPLKLNAEVLADLNSATLFVSHIPKADETPVWGIPVTSLFHYAPNGIKDAEHLHTLIRLLVADDAFNTTLLNVRQLEGADDPGRD